MFPLKGFQKDGGLAAADPGLFERGGCKYESSRQTSLGQEMGEGELGGNVLIHRFSAF